MNKCDVSTKIIRLAHRHLKLASHPDAGFGEAPMDLENIHHYESMPKSEKDRSFQRGL